LSCGRIENSELVPVYAEGGAGVLEEYMTPEFWSDEFPEYMFGSVLA
jgi:hypothetical protein